MRKKTFLFAVLSVAGWAAVTVSTSEVTPFSVQVEAVVSAAGYVKVAYQQKSGSCPGSGSSLTQAEPVKSDTTQAGNGGTAYQSIVGLSPSTTYCYAAQNVGTSEWSAVGEVTTSAYSGGRPVAPTAVNVFEPGPMPTINGNTYTVNAGCTNLQAHIDAARVVAGSANHQIVIPAGTVCTASYYIFEGRVGTGWIVVRTATPDAQLPPEGTRLNPADWAGKFATLRTNGCSFDYSNAPLRIDSTSRWRFVGLEITIDTSACSGLSSVASITTGGTTTVGVTGHGLTTSNLVRFISTPGVTGLTGTTYPVTVADANTFTVAAATSGTYTGSGTAILADPGLGHRTLVAANNTSTTDIVIDRCWLHGEDFPYRLRYGAFLAGERMAIINSTVEKVSYPYLATASAFAGNADFTPVAIDFSSCRRCTIRNNYVSSHGFSMFAQDSNAFQTADILISGNHLVMPDRYRHNPTYNAANTDHIYQNRMLIELKNGERVEISGNLLEGNFHSASSPANAIGFYLRNGRCCGNTTINTISDIVVRDNIIRNSASGIQIVGEDGWPTFPNRHAKRIAITNNLIYGLDSYRYRRLLNANNTQHSSCFWLVRSITDILIDRNTCWSMAGDGPYSLLFGNSRGGFAQVTRNIFTWSSTPNGANTKGGFFLDWDSGTLPSIGPTSATLTPSTFTTAWAGYWKPSAILDGNLFVGGVRDGAGQPATFASTTLSDQWNKYSLCDGAAGVLKDMPGNYCAGTNSANDGTESANARLTHVAMRDTAAANYRLRMNSPFAPLGVGADLDAIDAARGLTSNLRVLSITSSGATVAYMAPNTAACTVEYGTSTAPGTGDRVVDTPAGSRFRALALTGLTGATTYYYRVLCAQMETGSFSTL